MTWPFPVLSPVLWIVGLYGQLSDVWQGHLSELLDGHTLDIEIFGPYEQIYDEQQGDFCNLPDIDPLDIGIIGPYVKISDE